MTIGNLPEELLLEIFDYYRRSFCTRSTYLRDWNSKNGWFKLAHVCHRWRIVILASPSRLELRIYFAHDTPARAVVLECLSHLPIVVNYRGTTWTAGTPQRFVSALRFPDRVCAIAYAQPRGTFSVISKALDSPFPALLSLDVDQGNYPDPISLPTSFMSSVRSLQHLRLNGARLPSLLPLFSAARALTRLVLNVDKVFCPGPEASLLTHLQHMPHLRLLDVTVLDFDFAPGHIENSSTTVLLPKLTDFRFFGARPQTELFVAGLVTPSLQGLHIFGIHLFVAESPTYQIANYVSKFIRVAGAVFLTAQLTMSLMSPKISLFAYPHSIDDKPFKKLTMDVQMATHWQLGSALSATLAILEEIFLFGFDLPPFYFASPFGNSITWRKFFEEFRNVKVLRLHHGLETKVADLLGQPNVNPAPPQEEVGPDAMTPLGTTIESNDSQFPMDIFPSLEEIVVYPRRPYGSIDAGERASVLASFVPFANARYRAGRPVKLFWNTDGRVPKHGLP